MTPLDDETQRILAIYDEWLACKCGEYERWAEDGAGRCKHERALHYEAETACELIRSLSERLARVEGEVREECAKVCDDEARGWKRAAIGANTGAYDYKADAAEDCARAIRHGAEKA